MKIKYLFTHFALSSALLIFSALSSQAATYVVTNTNDNGEDSLRAAIGAANSTPANDVINFNIQGCPNDVCTIQLTGGQLSISSALGAGSLSIYNSSGADKLRIFGGSTYPNYFRVLGLDGGAVATIDGVTFSNGFANLIDGSGINNYGNLTLKNSVVSYNRSSGGNDVKSAGIHNAPNAVLTLIKTTVSNNENRTTTGGGGICNNGGSLTITDSIVSNNRSRGGGGIYNAGGMTITNSSVNSNYAEVDGGNGIYNLGTAVINNSNINSNLSFQSVGGGINNTGTITLNDSTISGNEAFSGGAIYSTGTSTFNNSTVSENIAAIGAGIDNAGNLIVTNTLIKGNHDGESYSFFAGGGINNQQGATANIANTTIVENYMLYNAGGIANAGAMTLTNSTVTRNRGNNADTGAGVIVYSGGTLYLRNTIVAENLGLKDVPSDICSFDAFIVSNGNNFIQADTCGSTWQSSDILNQSPRFAPLGNYGGATETLALTNNSPAVNVGNNCVLTANGCGDNNPAIATDMRGAARVGGVDIGAFEINNTANGGNFRAITTSGAVSVPFNYLLTTDSGAFTYSVTAGSLPPGLSLSNSLAPQAGAYSITGTPTFGGTFNYTITATDGTNSVSTNYSTTIQAAPTAANVSVSGRVFGGNYGVANAQVILTGSNGQAQLTKTNSFGYFRFEEIPAGETYVISIRDKRYIFAPQIISPNDDVAELEFNSISERQISSTEMLK